MRRSLLALAVASSLFAFASPASAQIHFDAGGEIGLNKRFLSSSSLKNDPGFGPFLQLEGHVALLPLVRAGIWLGKEISPMPDPIAARDLTSFGLHLKLMSPVPTGNLRLWLFTGFGYDIVSQRSYDIVLPLGPPGSVRNTTGTVQSSGGGFFEVPVGIGASYKLRGPLALFATLGAHIGFGFSGSVYESPGPQVKFSTGDVDQNVNPNGNDAWGLGLGVGVLLDL